MSTVSGARSMSKKVLVLGGTGFVGSNFVKRSVQRSYEVVSISRRGALPNQMADSSVKWVKGDATDAATLQNIVSEHGPFDACVHTLGVLFDGQSGLKGMNIYVSGSKSVVDESTTYDQITRATAFNAIEAISKQHQAQVQPNAPRIPFVFVSAAEAGWTFDAPVQWLQRYLIAKRAVESKLLESTDILRPVIMRPSLIWSWSNPEKVAATIPFFIGSAIGLPFVDRPVQVEALTEAMLQAIERPEEEGVRNFRDVDRLTK